MAMKASLPALVPVTRFKVIFLKFAIREPSTINEHIYIPDIYKAALGNPK